MGVGSIARAPRLLSPAAIRDLLLVALTFSSGAVDAISFLALGKVFTAFMTGNLVYVVLLVAGAPGPELWRVAVSLAAFSAGVFLSTRVVRGAERFAMWPRQVTVTLGVAAVAQGGFLAVWAAAAGRPSSGAAAVLIGLSALAMGMQSGAVLALGVTGVFTTAATASLVVLMRDVAEGSYPATEPRRLAGVLAGLLAGAGAGGLLLEHARTYAPVLPLVATALVIATASLAQPLTAGRR
jgi:uncharacterized membrane protein YoaK (UPF0700 family)